MKTKTIVCIIEGSTGDFLPSLNLSSALHDQGYTIRGFVPQDLQFVIKKYGLTNSFEILPIDYTELTSNNPMFSSGSNGLQLFRESGKLFKHVTSISFPKYAALFDELEPKTTTLIFNSAALSLYGALAWVKGFRHIIIADPYFYADPKLKYEAPQFVDMPNFIPVGMQHRLFGQIAYQLLAAGIVKRNFREFIVYNGKIPSYDFLNEQAKRLYLVDPLLVDKREIAQQAARIIGYAHVPPKMMDSLPPDLQSFLERMRGAGKKVVGASFGSMQVQNEHHSISEMIAQVCSEKNCALVMFKGWGGLQPIQRDDIYYLDRYLDYGSIFPAIDALITHGGSGTCHEALRAGTPLVLARVLSDQEDWAKRMQRLGFLQEPLAIESLSVARLKSALSYALDESVLQKTRAIGVEVQQRQNQLDQFIRLIEQR